MAEKETETADSEFESAVKKKNRRITAFNFVRLVVVVVLFLLLGIYMMTPLSTIRNLDLKGTVNLRAQDIYRILNRSERSSLYSIDTEEAEELLNGFPLIEDAKVRVSPFRLGVELSEEAPAASYKDMTYSTFGRVYEEDVLADPLVQDYFSAYGEELSVFLSDPAPYEGHLREPMAILAGINRDRVVRYTEMDTEKSFYFYYRLNSNSSYLRVKLNYDSGFATEEYIKNLSMTSEQAQNFVDLAGEERTLETEEVSLRYFAVRARLIRDARDHKVKIRLERDL